MASDDLDLLDDAALKREVIRLRAEVAKGAETASALEDAYVELGDIGVLLHELQPAHKKAMEELERLRPICVAQAQLIEQQRAHLRDLDALRTRQANERRRLEGQVLAASERYNELQRREAAMSSAIAGMTVQLEILCNERADIVSYVFRLGEAVAHARARMLDAQRSEHEYLAAFADELGSVAAIGERVGFVGLLRRRLTTLLAQIETMDERVAALETSRAKSRAWWR